MASHHMFAANNDSVLASVIEADGTAARNDAIADVIAYRARTVIDRVLGPYRRSGFTLSPEDLDDIASSVSLRLLRKLRAVAETGEVIERFDDYVAALTFNTAYDYLRRRYPRRARLKNRLRYVTTRDRRLAMWGAPDAMLTGLAAWRGRRDVADVTSMQRHTATAEMLDSAHPAEAVIAILDAAGAPVRFDDLVRVVAELWSVVDLREAPGSEGWTPPTQLATVESRQTLRLVWDEIRNLRPQQRCALLLNLREGEEGNAVALLVVAGIASLAEIAATLEMPVVDLAELWGRLPIDDRAIAERLGLTRQQVINLRKSARARLARRMAALSARRM